MTTSLVKWLVWLLMLLLASVILLNVGHKRARQVVQALEGYHFQSHDFISTLSLEELNEGFIPGEVWSTTPMEAGNTYSTHEYKDDMKKFQKLALESQEQEWVFVYRSRVSCVQE